VAADEQVRGVAALDHPITGAVYRLLVERGDVSREDATDELGVARSVPSSTSTSSSPPDSPTCGSRG